MGGGGGGGGGGVSAGTCAQRGEEMRGERIHKRSQANQAAYPSCTFGMQSCAMSFQRLRCVRQRSLMLVRSRPSASICLDPNGFSSTSCTCACVCACVCMCVYVCVCACICPCERVMESIAGTTASSHCHHAASFPRHCRYSTPPCASFKHQNAKALKREGGREGANPPASRCMTASTSSCSPIASRIMR